MPEEGPAFFAMEHLEQHLHLERQLAQRLTQALELRIRRDLPARRGRQVLEEWLAELGAPVTTDTAAKYVKLDLALTARNSSYYPSPQSARLTGGA